MTLYEFDQQEYVHPLCGVDEAGRGPLAGDLYAAAVILPQDYCEALEDLNDSKKLTEKKRDFLYDIIVENCICYSVGIATLAEIEELNVLNATLLAMQRAVDGLSVTPKLVIVDGNRNPRLNVPSHFVIKGDQLSACIAAASIIAKVSRDRYMTKIAKQYPQYQFEKHKGYGTALHYKLLDEFGISDIHRRSFLKKYLNGTPNMNQLTGKRGEDAAVEYLTDHGYKIVDRNVSSKYGELDIIAQKDGILAFVEVKARKVNSVITAREAVGKSKQIKLIKTAVAYLRDRHTMLQPRFDVIEVYFDVLNAGLVHEINFIENAFTGDGLDVYI